MSIEKDQELLTAAEECDVDRVRDLLEAGANAAYEKYVTGTWGAYDRISPIHAVLQSRYKKVMTSESNAEQEAIWIKDTLEIVAMLLEAGAKINAVCASYDWRGCGSSETGFQLGLELAERLDSADLLRLLLQHGGDPNMEMRSDAHTMRYDGQEKWGPIHTAAQSLKLEILNVLLEAGARVDLWREHQGHSEYGSGEDTKETALHIACYQSATNEKEADTQCEIVSKLIKAGSNVNAVRHFLETHTIPGVSEERRQDPRSGNYVNPYKLIPVQETPLHIAVKMGQVKLIYMLLSAGADIFIPYKRGEEWTQTWKMTKDSACLKALEQLWTPATHRMHPKTTQSSIMSMFIVAKRLNWPLPSHMLYTICQFIAYQH